MTLNYDKIRKVHRLEQTTSKLVKIDDNFLDDIKEFLETSKVELRNNKDLFDDSKIRQYQNVRNMLEDILYLRQKKIINLAIIKVKTNDVDEMGMIHKEKILYNSIISLINGYLSYLKDSDTNKSRPVLVHLRLLKNVPKFIGTDMQEYGPFKEEDIVDLPESIAKLLMAKEIARLSD